MTREIRFSADGGVSMVWEDGEPLRCVHTDGTDDDLPVGDDMSEEEIELLDD